MKLEDQVCSLELAKKLKELGVKQESIFWWSGKDLLFHPRQGAWVDDDGWLSTTIGDDAYSYAAFTVAEIGEMLPYTAMGAFLLGFKGDDDYACAYGVEKTIRSTTEADTRAKMLIYLLENKLITL